VVDPVLAWVEQLKLALVTNEESKEVKNKK